jgi:hypothetical protein
VSEGVTDGVTEVPPHDLDAEAALLSCVLVDPLALPRARALVAPEHFYSEAHRQTFKAALAVAAAGSPVDSVTVGARLRDTSRLAQVGGLSYLAELLVKAPAMANVVAYGTRVREMWSRRQVIVACQNISARGYLGAEDAAKLLGGLRDSVERLADEHAAADPVTTLNAQDLAEPLPPVPYLVPGLGLAPGPISLVAGYGFSGKTLAMQDLALAVATESLVWGVYACRRGPVLHLDYEQGRYLTQERYQRLARGRKVDLAKLAPDALRVACMPPVYLDRNGGADALARMFEGKALVLVDSLRAAAPSADENSSEIRRHLDVLTRAAERTGATVVVIHHARKPSKEHTDGAKFAIRGSSALFDASASVFVFEGVKGEPTKVHHEKDRIRGDCRPSFGLAIEDVGRHDNPRWGLRVLHNEPEQLAVHEASVHRAPSERRLEKIRAFLVNRSPFKGSRVALCEAVGMRRNDFFAALSILERQRDVVITESKGIKEIRWVSGPSVSMQSTDTVEEVGIREGE